MTDGKGEERPDSGGDLVAVAEVSLQVPNGRTAPPFPVPLVVKKVSLRERTIIHPSRLDMPPCELHPFCGEM